jgi:hypothetical protein
MVTKRKSRKPDPESANCEVDAREEAALTKHISRIEAEAPAPRVKVQKKGNEPVKISLDHPDQHIGYVLLKEALGTANNDFLHGLIGQLNSASSKGQGVDELGLNFMLDVIKGIKPTDQIETMLGAQMAAVHVAAMTLAGRLSHAETIQQHDSAERAFNKLTRTFVTQMEALKRYRSGGEQNVTVQHVSVGEGGQAIVGNVTQTKPETPPEQPANSPRALTDARKPAMEMIDKRGNVIPVRRRQRDDG